MKKILFILLAFIGIRTAAQGQVTLTVDNQTPQFFIATLVDASWLGAQPTNMNLDIPVSQVSYHPYVEALGVNNTMSLLTNGYNWRGVLLRSWPAMLYYFPVYFTTTPYSTVASGFPGTPTYNIDCNVISATDISIRITP